MAPGPTHGSDSRRRKWRGLQAPMILTGAARAPIVTARSAALVTRSERNLGRREKHADYRGAFDVRNALTSTDR